MVKITIIIVNIIGEFGIVYKGKMSEGFNKPFDQIVAVKTLKG